MDNNSCGNIPYDGKDDSCSSDSQCYIPPPTVNVKANNSDGPISITAGTGATISWTSTGANANSCTGTNGSSGWAGGGKALSGSYTTGNLSAGTYTYTLTCTGDGGSGYDSVTINVSAPAPPTLTFTIDQALITAGTGTTLRWNSSSTNSCTGTGPIGWAGGGKALSGSYATGNLLPGTYTYTLACTGAGGTISRDVTVEVASPASPSVVLSASSSTIVQGDTSTLSWTSQNVARCFASSGWTGTRNPSGTEVVQPNSTTVYTITCENDFGGSDSAQATVTVTPPASPVITSFSATPLTINSGDSSTLSWTTENAETCFATDGWEGYKDTNDSEPVFPDVTTTYTLTCFNQSEQEVTADVTVTVVIPPGAPTLTFDVAPTVIHEGQDATLTWDSTHTTGCTASGAWTGPQNTSGTKLLTGLSAGDHTYAIECSGAGGSAQASVTVRVDVNPPISSVAMAVMVMGLPENHAPAVWSVSAPDDAEWVHATTTTVWFGSHDDGLGAYEITVASIPGFTVAINGVEATSTAVQVTPGYTSWVWVVEYTAVPPPHTCGPIVLSSATTTAPDASLSVDWSNPDEGCSDSTDWIGLVRSGSHWSNGDPWAYWNGSQLVPTLLPPNDGTLSLTVPAGAVKIQFVYYRADGFTEAGRSAEITVVPPACATGDCDPMVLLGCRSANSQGSANDWSDGLCISPIGGTVLLRWDSLNATACSVSSNPAGLWSGSATKAPNGIAEGGPITANNTLFKIQCTGPGGTSTVAQVRVDIAMASPVPTLSFTCAPEGGGPSQGPCSIPTGEYVDLEWGGNNLLSCTASGDTTWTGPKQLSGISTQGPIIASHTYGLSCTGTNGLVIKKEVTINPNHTTCDSLRRCLVVPGAGSSTCASDAECAQPKHSACRNNSCVSVVNTGTDPEPDECSDASVCMGDVCTGAGCGSCVLFSNPNRLVIPPSKATTISWNCVGVSNCTISRIGQVTGLSGSVQARPTETTTYTLSCDALGGGTVNAQTKVRVFEFGGGVLREKLPR